MLKRGKNSPRPRQRIWWSLSHFSSETFEATLVQFQPAFVTQWPRPGIFNLNENKLRNQRHKTVVFEENV